MNISNDDIVDGNPKLTLGLMWYIISHFQVRLHCSVQCIQYLYSNSYSCCLGLVLVYNVILLRSSEERGHMTNYKNLVLDKLM